MLMLMVQTTLGCLSQTSEDSVIRNSALLDEIIQRSVDSGLVDSAMGLYVQWDLEIKLYADAYPTLSSLSDLQVVYLNGNDALGTGDSFLNQEIMAIIVDKLGDTITISNGLLFVNMETGTFGITPIGTGTLAQHKLKEGSIVESKE